MTGVTSVSLDSITSGFGIQWNISQIPAFADAVGFTEEEVRRLIVETQDLKGTQTGDVPLARMKDYYNGYRFSPQGTAKYYLPRSKASWNRLRMSSTKTQLASMSE